MIHIGKNDKIYLYNFIERSGCISDMMPSSLQRRVMPMNTMEVLTLLIVVFAALSYIDNHNNKKK